MREHKFRGRYSNGAWVHASSLESGTWWGYLWGNCDPDTIGQFVGRQDSSGIDIYEGDVVKAFHSHHEVYHQGVVIFKDCTFQIKGVRYWSDGVHEWYSMEQYTSGDLEIVGNVWDNPELVERGVDV